MSVTGDQLRQVMSRFATGVTVVTTTAGEHDHAMTANTFTSVSLDPPLVLVCVEQDTSWHDSVTAAGVWGVSILPASSRAAAGWLSTGGRPLLGQLGRVPHHRGELGVALLDQRNLAGPGNLYKVEALFLCGVHPWARVGDVDDVEALVAQDDAEHLRESEVVVDDENASLHRDRPSVGRSRSRPRGAPQ